MVVNNQVLLSCIFFFLIAFFYFFNLSIELIMRMLYDLCWHNLLFLLIRRYFFFKFTNSSFNIVMFLTFSSKDA